MTTMMLEKPSRTAAVGSVQFVLLLLACLLMDEAAGMRSLRVNEVATLATVPLKKSTFGNQACPPIVGYEVFQGQDHPGDDIDEMLVQGPDTPTGPSPVAELCARTELCRAFTWRADGRMSSIKSAAFPRTASPHGMLACLYVLVQPTPIAIGLPLPDISPLKSCANTKGLHSFFINTIALGHHHSGTAACKAYGMTCVNVLDSACRPLDCSSSTEASRMVQCLSKPVDCAGPCNVTHSSRKVTQVPGVWMYDFMDRCVCIPANQQL